MERDEFLRLKAREAGHDCIEDFVRANLHYLPKDKREVFANSFRHKPYHAQGGGYGKS